MSDQFGWADDEIEALKALYAEGLSFSQIARALNAKFRQDRSRNAVIGKFHRLGLSGRAQPSKPARAPRQPRRPRPVAPVVPPRPAPVPLALIDAATTAGDGWPVPATAKPTLKLAFDDCRFPVGPGTGWDQLHCCAPKAEGDDAYCAEHRRICSNPRQPQQLLRNGRVPRFARS